MNTPSRPGISRTAFVTGFTLIELATVTAVLAILAILVFPALAGSNASSHEALCLSNHRQLVGAFDRAQRQGRLTEARKPAGGQKR